MRTRLILFWMAILVLVTACAPSPAVQPTTTGNTSAATAAQPAPRTTPKNLRIAILTEPSGFITSIGGITTTTGGTQQPSEIAHNWLTLTDANSEVQPSLAVELPSLEKGTWKVNSDGTMETTWKLKPNTRWHDGMPFTAADVVFGWEVVRDPAMPTARAPEARFISAIETPDPQTVVMKWNQIWVDANNMGRGTIEPLPRHLLADLFARDKDAFLNSGYWSKEFVGLGPFKLKEWAAGSHVELTRFDQYHRGPAKLDGIVIRFITDPNAQIASILSEDVDVVLPIGIDMEGARLVRERWTGTRNQVLIGNPQRLRFVSHQGRVEEQKQPALLDPRVRRALYTGLDRQELTEAVLLGFGEVADSFFPTNHSYRKDVEASIPQYPFDRAAAVRMLGEAGWTRGPDGTLRNAEGAPLAFGVQATRNQRSEKELPIIADGWRQIGAQVEEQFQPAAIVRDPEAWHRFPGMEIIANLSTSFLKERIDSRQIAAPANRWISSNYGGYANPAVDRVLDRLAVTIARANRIALTRELVREAMSDVAIMPTFWDPDPVLALAKVKGLPPPAAITQVHTWNVYEWDLE